MVDTSLQGSRVSIVTSQHKNIQPLPLAVPSCTSDGLISCDNISPSHPSIYLIIPNLFVICVVYVFFVTIVFIRIIIIYRACKLDVIAVSTVNVYFIVFVVLFF